MIEEGASEHDLPSIECQLILISLTFKEEVFQLHRESHWLANRNTCRKSVDAEGLLSTWCNPRGYPPRITFTSLSNRTDISITTSSAFFRL